MARPLILVSVAFCVIFAGCDRAALMKRYASPEDEAVARKYIDLLRQEKFEQIEHDLDPSIMNSDVRDALAKMSGMFPNGDPESIKVVGAHVVHSPGLSVTYMTFEYEFPSTWLVVDFTTERKGSSFTIVGFHVTPSHDSLENLNRFTLVGKGATQYWILAMAAFATCFSLYVFVLCVRAKNLKKKWLWAIFILIGVGKLAVNWTTGQWFTQFIAIQIPCANATAPFYGPWTVAVSLPLGAILFLLRERNNVPQTRPEPVIDAGSPPPPISPGDPAV